MRGAFLSGHGDRLARVFDELFATVQRRVSLSGEYKENYKKQFLEALLSYRHPVIFDPVEKRCYTHRIRDGEVSDTEAELLTHAPYAELVNDAIRRERITGKINPPLLSILIAEGYVCPRTQRSRKNMIIPNSVKAELIKLGIWKGDRTQANNSRRTSSSRAFSGNQMGGVKRKNMDDPRDTLNDEESSENEDFLDVNHSRPSH